MNIPHCIILITVKYDSKSELIHWQVIFADGSVTVIAEKSRSSARSRWKWRRKIVLHSCNWKSVFHFGARPNGAMTKCAPEQREIELELYIRTLLMSSDVPRPISGSSTSQWWYNDNDNIDCLIYYSIVWNITWRCKASIITHNYAKQTQLKYNNPEQYSTIINRQSDSFVSWNCREIYNKINGSYTKGDRFPIISTLWTSHHREIVLY